ncbi:MAG TPA: SOS response-associated peptidase family protein [Rhizomicrobium sp.]|jgi:putative SOS response-associated peptidase YedK|nr:SOS response-associated peptidase family protein [Rhizomicrobium sp.]
MCGKFTTKASWTEIVDFIWSAAGDPEDRIITRRVMDDLPVIVLEGEERRVMPMRWGFPDAQDWRRPKPIHARSETIETTRAFAPAFHGGQRGIVLMKSFNEAPDIDGPTIQHVITPGDDEMLAAAFVWQRYDIAGLAQPLFACVLVTVPANSLIATLPTDRMPAFLAQEDWGTWLGETPASPKAVKACLKTVEGVRWTMNREERARTARRAKPFVSDPTGLF